jgi:hypothetical protein
VNTPFTICFLTWRMETVWKRQMVNLYHVCTSERNNLMVNWWKTFMIMVPHGYAVNMCRPPRMWYPNKVTVQHCNSLSCSFILVIQHIYIGTSLKINLSVGGSKVTWWMIYCPFRWARSNKLFTQENNFLLLRTTKFSISVTSI